MTLKFYNTKVILEPFEMLDNRIFPVPSYCNVSSVFVFRSTSISYDFKKVYALDCLIFMTGPNISIIAIIISFLVRSCVSRAMQLKPPISSIRALVARHAMPIDKSNFSSLIFLLILILNGKEVKSSRPVIHESYQISRVSPAVHRPVPPQNPKSLPSPHNVHNQKAKFIDNKDGDELNEDEVFDKMEFVRNSRKRQDEIYKFEKRTYGWF